MDKPRLIVDSHLHLWADDSDHRPWPKSLSSRPHKSHGVDKNDLLHAMDAAGVDRAILIPPSWEGHYNDLALAAAGAHPDRFAVMGRLSLEDPASRSRLLHWRRQPGMLGVRFIFHSPRYQALLVEGAFDWVWAEAEAASVPITVMMPGLATAAGIIERILIRHPGLKLSLDHINLPPASHSSVTERIKKILRLSMYPNLAIKVSAMPALSQGAYPFADMQEPLKKIFDAYGPKRMFWGTDLTRLSVTYDEAMGMFTEHIDWLKGDDLDWVMGKAVCEWLGWR